MNAYNDLLEHLNEGEVIEAIVFGEWGWGSYGEETVAVPPDKQGVLLTPEEAKPLMKGWSFNGGYGSPECYAVNVWTNQRLFWVTQYDGMTWLDSAPRNPTAYIPDMPGG